MKKLILILILILLSIPIFSQNKLLYTNAGKALIKDSLDIVRAEFKAVDDSLAEDIATNMVNLAYPDERTIRLNDANSILLDNTTLKLNASNEIEVIAGGGVIPDSVVYASELTPYATKTVVGDSLNARMGAVLDIDDLAVVKDYEPVIADSSILLYSGGVWSIFDLSEALSATANNAINITYPDANTISFNDTNVLLLDPLTLEINGSNQLTVIGGTGGSVGNADSLGGKPASEYLVKNDSTAQRTFSDLKYATKAQLSALQGEVDAIPIVSISYPDANTIEIATGESIILDPSTLEISGGNLTVVGGSLIDTAIVNALIEANEDTSGSAIIGTTETLDSLITDYWNDNLGSGSAWDSTYAYQRITALENDVSALQDTIAYFTNAITSILAALDTCGCSAVVEDNTPPLAPTSYVAIGGTSQTQYVSTWTDPVAGDLDSIRFYEGTSNDTTALVWVTSIAKGVETYTRTGRTANTTYWAGVKAVDDSGNVSWFSNLDSAKTLASGSPPDTGFYKFDAEDGLANLVLENGGFITDTSGFAHTGTHSYKFRGNGTTAPVYADIYPFPSGYGDEATIWVSYYVYIPSSTTTNVTSGNYQYLTLFGDSADVNGDAGWLGISTDASGNIDNWVKPWGTELSTGFATDTWLKVEHKYVRGTGANGQDSIWVNGTLIYGTSNATGTITTSRFRFGYPGGNSWRPLSGEAIYFDDIILKRTRVQ